MTAHNRTRRQQRLSAYDLTIAARNLPINAVVDNVVVDDPYAVGKVTVTRNLRDDPLGRLHARRQIDDASFYAGRRWQMLYEDSEIGTVGSIDPTRVHVDGGSPSEPLTERRQRAAKEIAAIDWVLGREGAYLVRDILGEGLTMRQAAYRRGGVETRYIDYLARRLRECLATMAAAMGLAT